MAAEIRLQETETRGGWSFSGRIGDAGTEREVEMSLSWADYEYWSRGLVRPVDVARALLRVATADSSAGTLPGRFDAARLRSSISGLDEKIRGQLGFEEVGSDPGLGRDPD